jgi:hypothetical protein
MILTLDKNDLPPAAAGGHALLVVVEVRPHPPDCLHLSLVQQCRCPACTEVVAAEVGGAELVQSGLAALPLQHVQSCSKQHPHSHRPRQAAAC